MPIKDPTAINLAVPLNRVDQIIGIHSGAFTVNAPSAIDGFLTASDSFVTGFGDSCNFQGIFSVDGGASWNDFGVYRPNLSTPGAPVFQTVTCRGYITSLGLFVASAINWYDNVHATSSSYTVNYKVAFLAKDTQGILTPIPTNEKLYWHSKYNFQKVSTSGSFANSGSNTAIAHGLGYVPKVRAFFVTTNDTTGAEGIVTVPAGSLMTLDWFLSIFTSVYVDSSNLTFTPIQDSVPSTVPGTVNWRIYLDN